MLSELCVGGRSVGGRRHMRGGRWGLGEQAYNFTSAALHHSHDSRDEGWYRAEAVDGVRDLLNVHRPEPLKRAAAIPDESEVAPGS